MASLHWTVGLFKGLVFAIRCQEKYVLSTEMKTGVRRRTSSERFLGSRPLMRYYVLLGKRESKTCQRVVRMQGFDRVLER